MPRKPVFVISDLHLGAVPPDRDRAFTRWLEHAAGNASRVVINGDLFDFWFEYGTVVSGRYVRTLAALSDVVDAGVPVTMLGGNHDWWGGRYLREVVGLEFHQEPVTTDLLGRTALIAHGDGLGAGDVGYLVLRFVLRGRPTRWAFRWLHPDLGDRVASWVSRTLDRQHPPDDEQLGRAHFLETWARERMAADPSLDLVLLGHCHVPSVVEVEPGRYYLNSGDWVYHRTYGVIDADGPPRLEEWPI